MRLAYSDSSAMTSHSVKADLDAAIDRARLTDDEYVVLIETVETLVATRWLTRADWSDNRLIALLKRRAPDPVSDSELQLAITNDTASGGCRQSVANSVCALRKQGWKIIRERNFGYRMEKDHE